MTHAVHDVNDANDEAQKHKGRLQGVCKDNCFDATLECV